MSLTQKLKDDLLTARKEKYEIQSGILRVLLGEIEQEQVKTGVELPDDRIYSMIRKIQENNIRCMAYTSSDKLIGENNILNRYLPTLLNPLEILALISPELHAEILSSDEKSIGKFTGKILKIIKERNLSSNGNDVNKVIQDIIQQNTEHRA